MANISNSDAGNNMKSALRKCITVCASDDPLFVKKSVHFTATYDGTLESFSSCCRGIKSSDCLLDEYGFTIILDMLPSCYEEKDFAEVASVIITHYGHGLIRMQNTSMCHSVFIASLDLADLIDEVSTKGLSSKRVGHFNVKMLRDAHSYTVDMLKQNMSVVLPVMMVAAMFIISLLSDKVSPQTNNHD
jgi:hypothetical protein